MCALSREEFCGRAPSFVGDILWEHLVLLQQDVDRDAAALKNAPSNLSETSTDPVSMPRLPPSPPGAQQPQYHQSPQKTYLIFRIQCSGQISPGKDNITLLTPSSLPPHQSYLR